MQWLQLSPDQTLSCRGAESSKDRRIRRACTSVSERRDSWTSKVKIGDGSQAFCAMTPRPCSSLGRRSS
ncbi:hypothetical protein OJAV_G00228580 [Oryzias javanicus]|uniref:Uncharacterized protein n=1 Tax=Oryzias javanicus TaxID=123683 RepID=A0A3S2LX63_ORYJA|nr:hypothetical protein OJAV_G00228580 [Oryzias javanicus]